MSSYTMMLMFGVERCTAVSSGRLRVFSQWILSSGMSSAMTNRLTACCAEPNGEYTVRTVCRQC